MEPEPQPSSELSPWEIAMIDVFVRAAALIGLPRSVGEIYGLLYCSSAPLSFDDVVERLGISRGSVSQGLKLLRQLGAVKLHYQPGSRKDHYLPELSVERLVRGFVKDQFAPHLESSTQRLGQIGELIEQEGDPDLRRHAAKRLDTLHTWQQRTRKLLPLALAVFGGSRSFGFSEAGVSEGGDSAERRPIV